MTGEPNSAAPTTGLDSLVGQVADEFLRRQERGERPDPEEYAARHPEAASLIRNALQSLRLTLSGEVEIGDRPRQCDVFEQRGILAPIQPERCADGKSLNIGGSNNTLTVKGTCANVNIGGADNKVTFDKIDKAISVVGLNNTVTYKDGDPKVNDTGSNNKISKG